MWKWLVKNITEYQIWIKYMFGKHAVYRQKYFNTSLASWVQNVQYCYLTFFDL